MRILISAAFLLLCTILFCSSSWGLERFDIVTTEELRDLLQERETGKTDFLLVNTLDTLIADHHTIPGSVNVPWSSVEKSEAVLGRDKNKLIITYCMGYR